MTISKYMLLGFGVLGIIGILILVGNCEDTSIIDEHEQDKKEFQIKIQTQDEIIIKDSVAIFNSDRAALDSMRTIRFNKYMHKDTL